MIVPAEDLGIICLADVKNKSCNYSAFRCVCVAHGFMHILAIMTEFP